MYDSIRLHRYLGYSFRPWRALGLFLPGAWFSSWYVVSIDTGHIAQSPQSGPRWSPAFKIEPVLFPPSQQALIWHPLWTDVMPEGYRQWSLKL